MKGLSLGITFRVDVDLKQALFSNGISQNIKFYYDLLTLMGHKPFFLTDMPVPGKSLSVKNRKYRALSYKEVLDEKKKLDIAFEAGVSINQAERNVLREQFGTRIVSLRYGHAMVMDMEQVFLHETMSPGLHVSKPDYLWTTPHLKNGAQYLSTIYDCPVRICPYIWEPDFVGSPFASGDYAHTPDIYVMEPNVNILKNALIPMAIIEQVYRAEPHAFGKATILNGKHFQNQKYFLENIVRNMSSLVSSADKVYFTGRYNFDDVFTRPNILLGHQWDCELNYLYFEALYKGVPCVHNSSVMREVGFYYPGFEVLEGKEQCLKAIRSFQKTPAEGKKNNAFISRYSINNRDVKNEFGRLIDEVLS
ncbi:MAG: DUF2827 domain-containing protein [Gammaproteobacteria bacterium]|nr:DUF2827 domain-containing protein [Gammaproteobacteria bacterium]